MTENAIFCLDRKIGEIVFTLFSGRLAAVKSVS